MHVCICTYPPERQHPCFPGRLVGETSCLQKSKGLNIGSKISMVYIPSFCSSFLSCSRSWLVCNRKTVVNVSFCQCPSAPMVPEKYFTTVPTTGPQRKPKQQLTAVVPIVTVSFQGYNYTHRIA